MIMKCDTRTLASNIIQVMEKLFSHDVMQYKMNTNAQQFFFNQYLFKFSSTHNTAQGKVYLFMRVQAERYFESCPYCQIWGFQVSTIMIVKMWEMLFKIFAKISLPCMLQMSFLYTLSSKIRANIVLYAAYYTLSNVISF